MKINHTELFRRAHILAKQILGACSDYHAALSAALKQIWAVIKTETKAALEEALKVLPGKMQKGGHEARPILRPGEGARPGQER